MKRYRSLIVLCIVLLGFGGIMLAFSLIDGYRYYDTYLSRVKIEGSVEDVNYKTGTTLIKYTVGDSTYQKELNIIDTSMNTGDVVDVYYNENYPSSCFVKSQIMYVIVSTCISGALIVLSFIFFIILIVLSRRDKYLKLNGEKIDAKIVSVKENRSVHLIARCPYTVICSYKVGKKTYKFKNSSVWFNIGEIIKEYDLKTIPVYVDGKNYHKYYMDLLDIENLCS